MYGRRLNESFSNFLFLKLISIEIMITYFKGNFIESLHFWLNFDSMPVIFKYLGIDLVSNVFVIDTKVD